MRRTTAFLTFCALMCCAIATAIPASAAGQIGQTVTIEPTSWTMVSSDGGVTYNDPAAQPEVGYDGSKVSRAFFQFDLPADAVGKRGRFEDLTLQLVHSPNTDCSAATFGPGIEIGSTDPIDASTTWPGPSWGQTVGSPNATAHGDAGLCPGSTPVVWTGGRNSSPGALPSTLTVGLRSADETNPDSWRVFAAAKPTLVIHHSSTPDQPSNLRLIDPELPCGTLRHPARIGMTVPTFALTVTDPDGTGQIYTRWETARLRPDGGSDPVGLRTIGAYDSGDEVQLQMPLTSPLEPNKTYYVRVWAFEYWPFPQTSPWTPNCYVRTS